METKEIERKLDEFIEVLSDTKNKLDIDTKENRIKELDNIMSDPSFWNTSNTTDVISESKAFIIIFKKVLPYDNSCEAAPAIYRYKVIIIIIYINYNNRCRYCFKPDIFKHPCCQQGCFQRLRHGLRRHKQPLIVRSV